MYRQVLLNSLQSFWYFQKPHLSDSSGNNFLILGSEFWISYWCEEPTEVGVEGKTVIIWTKWSIDVEKSMKDESIKYSFEYYWQFVAGTEIYSVSVNWKISHQIIWLWIKIFIKSEQFCVKKQDQLFRWYIWFFFYKRTIKKFKFKIN